MKSLFLNQSLRTLLPLSIFIVLITASCLEDKCDATTTFFRWDPVVLSPAELRTEPNVREARILENPGKLYFYNHYILVNEIAEGIHIIDNSNPHSPQNVRFIEIPGNIDIAVRENILFADNYVDLLSINISDVVNPTLEGRATEVFPLFGKDIDGNYIVDYVPTAITTEIPCNDPVLNQGWFLNGPNLFMNDDEISTTGGNAIPQGVAGSMASFALKSNFLYAVNNNALRVFDVNAPADIQLMHNTIGFGWGIETIFPMNDYLFIGANNGMHILDNSNPSSPEYLTTFSHANACDPVFVQGDIAYVTLRDGRECETFTNQLDVIDISNIAQPELMASYQMFNPHGLSVRDDNLYLCEGEQGLKIFDITDPLKIDQNLLGHDNSFDAFDVISLSDDHLLLIGQDGLYQFDVSNPDDVRQISLIPVSK